MLNTVCLLGSPRRGGNSDALAERFIGCATGSGATVERFALSEMQYHGCVNLFECKKGLTHCGQQDALTPVLTAISRAPVLVLASPVYFTGLSGQMKLAVDRFFSFLLPDYATAAVKSRLSPKRHLVLLQTQGEPEARYADLLQNHSAGFNTLGFEHLHLVRAWGVREPGDLSRHPQFLQRCEEVARSIYGSASPTRDH